MKKNLSERMSEKAKIQPSLQRGGQYLASLIAMQDEIQQALSDGWSKKAVWRQLQEENSFAGPYQAFVRVWDRHQRRQRAKGTSPVSPHAGSEQEKSPRIISDPYEKVFSFNNIKN